VEARRSQAPWTDDVRAGGESKRGRLVDPAEVSRGHGLRLALAHCGVSGVVIQGKFTHTFEGAAPQTGGPGSVWSQPAGQVHADKCEGGGDCLIAVYFHDKLDFKPVDTKAQ
jgi:hypothetical protein